MLGGSALRHTCFDISIQTTCRSVPYLQYLAGDFSPIQTLVRPSSSLAIKRDPVVDRGAPAPVSAPASLRPRPRPRSYCFAVATAAHSVSAAPSHVCGCDTNTSASSSRCRKKIAKKGILPSGTSISICCKSSVGSASYKKTVVAGSTAGYGKVRVRRYGKTKEGCDTCC